MSNLAVRLLAEPLRSLAFGSISGTYAGIGPVLANPCRIIHFTNNTDVLLTFSFDGVDDHFVIPSGSFLLLDITTNRTFTGGAMHISQGQRFYVKGSPGAGAVYLSVFYGAHG